MMSQTGLHKLADVIFGTNQKLPMLHHQRWSGNTSIIKEFFWTCFTT